MEFTREQADYVGQQCQLAAKQAKEETIARLGYKVKQVLGSIAGPQAGCEDSTLIRLFEIVELLEREGLKIRK
jgi:hypothetical protein